MYEKKKKNKKAVLTQETLLTPVGFQLHFFLWTVECFAFINHRLVMIDDCNKCKLRGTKKCYYELEKKK